MCDSAFLGKFNTGKIMGPDPLSKLVSKVNKKVNEKIAGKPIEPLVPKTPEPFVSPNAGRHLADAEWRARQRSLNNVDATAPQPTSFG